MMDSGQKGKIPEYISSREMHFGTGGWNYTGGRDQSEPLLGEKSGGPFELPGPIDLRVFK